MPFDSLLRMNNFLKIKKKQQIYLFQVNHGNGKSESNITKTDSNNELDFLNSDSLSAFIYFRTLRFRIK